MVVIGILVELLISATRLLRAVTRGVAMIFASPFCSPAEIIALSCAVPKKPVVRPSPVFAIFENSFLLPWGWGPWSFWIGGGVLGGVPPIKPPAIQNDQ